MLAHEPRFDVVATRLNDWFVTQLQGHTTGVLVSHNTATDIQFLCCEYMRCGATFPPQIKFGLDTLKTLQRFSTISYRRVPAEDWPKCTDTGKNSMGVKPCSVYALSKRNPPAKFEDVCGDHHDADADTRAVAVILFDEPQFGRDSLYHAVFKSSKRCFQPLEEIWTVMEEKMQEPVVEIEDLPPGWLPAQVNRQLDIIPPHLVNSHACIHPP